MLRQSSSRLVYFPLCQHHLTPLTAVLLPSFTFQTVTSSAAARVPLHFCIIFIDYIPSSAPHSTAPNGLTARIFSRVLSEVSCDHSSTCPHMRVAIAPIAV